MAENKRIEVTLWLYLEESVKKEGREYGGDNRGLKQHKVLSKGSTKQAVVTHLGDIPEKHDST